MMSALTLLREPQDLGSALPRKTQVLESLCPEIFQVVAPLPKSWHLSAKTWPLENLWIRPDGLWGFGTGDGYSFQRAEPAHQILTPQNVHLSFLARFDQIADKCDTTSSRLSTVDVTISQGLLPTTRVLDFINNDRRHCSKSQFC